MPRTAQCCSDEGRLKREKGNSYAMSMEKKHCGYPQQMPALLLPYNPECTMPRYRSMLLLTDTKIRTRTTRPSCIRERIGCVNVCGAPIQGVLGLRQ